MIDKVMFILDRELLDIELIDKNNKDYEYIIKGREERDTSPQNYGTLDNIDWD
jgi:hypothetical protein